MSVAAGGAVVVAPVSGAGVVVESEWDLGDGTLATGTAVQHTYAAPGTYWVRLTVRDDDGAPDTTIDPLEVGVTSLCTPAPQNGCGPSGGASLSIRDSPELGSRSLTWNWKRGAVDSGDLGDPRTTTEYALCVYDAGALAYATGVRPSARWTSLGAAGFRLREPGAAPGGLRVARLRAGGAPRGRLSVKGVGVGLPDLSLPLGLPVTVQLVASDTGACWESALASVTRNTSTQFKAR